MNHMKKSLAIAVALSAAAPLAWTQAQAPAATQPSSTTRIIPNFRDVPIDQLADMVGQATGKSFVVAPNVKAQLSLINPRPSTPTELYYQFLSLLQVNGFAAVPSGNVVKIVQDTNARQLPGNDLPASLNIGADEMVTTVIEVKNISANQISTVLRQLLSTSAVLQAIPGTNSMVITDRAGNVNRIQKILSRVDQTSTSGIDVIRLENATAADVVRTLNALTAGQPADAAAGLVPRIAADERSNSVLISGDPAQRVRLTAWIMNLDTPLENGGGTETRYLKYADAEKVQAKLKEQLTGIAAVTGTPGAAGAATAGGANPATIVAYKETNALIITAPPKLMRQLWAIVDKLDIPRAQVVVEAIIADVSTDKSADLGVNWAVFSNKDDTSTPAGGFISPVGNANGNPVSIVDLTQSVLNPAAATKVPLGATVAIGRLRDNGLNFAAMIRALRADANTNVIATPQLTAMDNQEAKLESGQDVPFITGQYTNSSTNTNGNVNPFTTVNRQKVGTILKVTPQINDGKMMTLNIELESSGLSGATGDAGSAITNTRSFKTSVRVEDGATIVIAGMIQDSKITGETRVPFLGRIPLIGEAFKTRNGKRTQTNLMVFLRPRIVTDGLQATIETNQKYNLIRDAQIKQGDKFELVPLLPNEKDPQLPPIAPVPAPATPPAGTDKPTAQ